MGFVIKPDEHTFITGMTGSGKTVLAREYVAGITKPVFVLDTKGTFEWGANVPETIVIKTLSEIQNAAGNYDKITYRPIHEELEFSWYDAFFQFCYNMKNCTVLVDEAMQVCPNSVKIPPYYKGILTRGRELGVNVYSCTQRPASIPVVIFSESTHWFIFQLNNMADRKRIADFTGYERFMQTVPKYDFLYFNTASPSEPELARLNLGRKGAK